MMNNCNLGWRQLLESPAEELFINDDSRLVVVSNAGRHVHFLNSRTGKLVSQSELGGDSLSTEEKTSISRFSACSLKACVFHSGSHALITDLHGRNLSRVIEIRCVGV